jgi:ankyrin repeat protein
MNTFSEHTTTNDNITMQMFKKMTASTDVTSTVKDAWESGLIIEEEEARAIAKSIMADEAAGTATTCSNRPTYTTAEKLKILGERMEDALLTNEYPLHTAAATAGQDITLKMLVVMGADVRQLDNDGFTPLHTAAAADHAKAVQILVEHGADVHAKGGPRSSTPLHLAATEGNVASMRQLLKMGVCAAIDEPNKAGSTALHLACWRGKLGAVQLLLDMGADVHIQVGYIKYKYVVCT